MSSNTAPEVKPWELPIYAFMMAAGENSPLVSPGSFPRVLSDVRGIKLYAIHTDGPQPVATWDDCPITDKLGVPLKIIPINVQKKHPKLASSGSRYNAEAHLLAGFDCDTFKLPTEPIQGDVMIARANGETIEAMDICLVLQYLNEKVLPIFHPLNTYGDDDVPSSSKTALEKRLTPRAFHYWYHTSQTTNLSYSFPGNLSEEEKAVKLCGNCFAPESKEKKLLQCGKCKKMWYCGKECQVQAWKREHKKVCKK